MMKGILFAAVLCVSPMMLFASSLPAEYDVVEDEFTGDEIHRLFLSTDDTQVGFLILGCYDIGFQAQLHSDRTIFPDSADGDSMQLSVTHRVDTAEGPEDHIWQMRMMQYNNAWLTGSEAIELLDQMIGGERISVRLNRSGTVFRFDLSDAQEYLGRLESRCG